jgi:hypothetical protein
MLFVCDICFSQIVDKLDSLNFISLRLVSAKDTFSIACGTGFVVSAKDKYYLITNWHVVTGRDPITGLCMDSRGYYPNRIYIWYYGKTLDSWERRFEPLYNLDSNYLWINHPLKNEVDVVALPLTTIGESIQIYPVRFDNQNCTLEYGTSITIIGFPASSSGSGTFPLKVFGTIGTDSIGQKKSKSIFFTYSKPFHGMSGSPVFLNKSQARIDNFKKTINPQFLMYDQFIGIFSSQNEVLNTSEIFKPIVIKEIIQQKILGAP